VSLGADLECRIERATRGDPRAQVLSSTRTGSRTVSTNTLKRKCPRIGYGGELFPKNRFRCIMPSRGIPYRNLTIDCDYAESARPLTLRFILRENLYKLTTNFCRNGELHRPPARRWDDRLWPIFCCRSPLKTVCSGASTSLWGDSRRERNMMGQRKARAGRAFLFVRLDDAVPEITRVLRARCGS